MQPWSYLRALAPGIALLTIPGALKADACLRRNQLATVSVNPLTVSRLPSLTDRSNPALSDCRLAQMPVQR